MSVRAYARRRGVTHPAVLKAIRSGRIPRLPDGTIDPEVADRSWAESTDPSKPKGRPPGRKPDRVERRKPRRPASPEQAAEEQPTPTTYAAARAVREAFAARTARLNFRKLDGALVEVGSVRRAGFEAGRAVREAFGQLLERVERRVGVAFPADLRAAVLAEVEDVLIELASNGSGGAPPEESSGNDRGMIEEPGPADATG